MRPCAPDALPLIGLVDDTTNVVLATGHNCPLLARCLFRLRFFPPLRVMGCVSLSVKGTLSRRMPDAGWGILWAPITGKLIAELVADGASGPEPP